jgi:hypothetical protein
MSPKTKISIFPDVEYRFLEACLKKEGSEREQPLAGDAVRDVPKEKLTTCTHFGISSLLSRRESIPEWRLSERRNESKTLCCFSIRNCSKREFIAVAATIYICVQ